MRRLALVVVLAVALMAPITTNAKIVRIQKVENQIPKKVKEKTPSKQSQRLMTALLQGKIAAVGSKAYVENLGKELESDYPEIRGWHYMEAVSPQLSVDYYSKLLGAPFNNVTDSEIIEWSKIGDYHSKVYYLLLAPSEARDIKVSIRVNKEERRKYNQYLTRRRKYWKLARKAVKKAGVKNGDSDRKAVRKMTNWLCKHTKYKRSKDNAKWGTVWRSGTGVCEDYADAFWAMAKVVGIPCKMVYGTAGGGHAWNKVKIGKKWYWLDVTWVDTGKTQKYYLRKKLWKNHHYEGKYKRKIYYKMTDQGWDW